ncbi:DUF2953 domain-containing protein [Lachnospiraceae bacterium 56-18]
MLHILVLILKVIGIIFAAILGILVLLACVVLYVPVRYDIRASCDGTFAGIRAGARVTWLLHLVGFYACYEEKELTWRIRIAWKNIRSGQEEKSTIRSEVETYDKEMEELWEDVEEGEEENAGEDLEEDGKENAEAVEEEGKEPGNVMVEETRRCREESGEAVESKEDRKELAEAVEGEEESADTGEVKEVGQLCEVSGEDAAKSEEGSCGEPCEASDCGAGCEEEHRSIWQKITDLCQSIWQKITGLYRKIADIPAKVKDSIENISEKIESLKGKKDKIVDFLTDEIHKKAFVKAKDELWRLLRKLRPKRVAARVRYGFEDPSLTGRILAGISVMYPFLGDDVRVYPDFERKVLDGNLEVAGKIKVSYFVWLLWKLVWCKDVRMTYRHVRNFKL